MRKANQTYGKISGDLLTSVYSGDYQSGDSWIEKKMPWKWMRCESWHGSGCKNGVAIQYQPRQSYGNRQNCGLRLDGMTGIIKRP
ncbi:hypothetical protein VTL71DRAFT_6365 [Oculimacula yallundae]|uniref:Uncharacterized protein n=1 Tax=Oculimacula yallundae TaxID=86028 RepID=A0ABR4BWR7_9HELO